MPKPRLQIIRGLPGSGKSTLARQNWPHLLQYEFDFFCMRGGQYAFGNMRNTEGQAWLSDVVYKALKLGIDLVVPGVFSGNGEHLPNLVKEALDAGYEVWIETLESSHPNTHGVRKADYDAMAATFKTVDELRQEFGDTVHYGSMPTTFEIAPMEDGK